MALTSRAENVKLCMLEFTHNDDDAKGWTEGVNSLGDLVTR